MSEKFVSKFRFGWETEPTGSGIEYATEEFFESFKVSV